MPEVRDRSGFDKKDPFFSMHTFRASKDNNHFAAKTFLEEMKNGKVRVKKILTSDYIIDETLTR